jgi:hypothetical protein
LDARKVKAGDPILAKLALAWKSPSCDLRQGAIIQGHVVTQKAHSKTEKTSEIGVVFDAGQCGGPDMKPLFLTVAAVVAPSPVRDSDSPYAENLQPLNTAVGLNLNSNVRSISQASATVFSEPRPAKASIPVTPGQVVGIPHLAISVGQGAEGASILSSTGHNVELSAGTQLALVPNLRAEPNGTGDAGSADPNAATGNATPEAAEPAPPNIADEREVCVAPDCTVALADSPVDQEIQGAQITFPLKGIGYPFQHFANAPATLTYIPHFNFGIPISGQPLHRPYVGMAENLSFLTKLIKLNLPLAVYAGPVFMKQQIYDTRSASLKWDHAIKGLYGIELPISAITNYMKGGSNSSKSGNASTPSKGGS